MGIHTYRRQARPLEDRPGDDEQDQERYEELERLRSEHDDQPDGFKSEPEVD